MRTKRIHLQAGEMEKLINRCPDGVSFGFGPSGTTLIISDENTQAMKNLLEIRDEVSLQPMRDFKFKSTALSLY